MRPRTAKKCEILEKTDARDVQIQVEPDDFFQVDRLVNPAVASLALRSFIDEVLSFSDSVQINEL
jgi:tRNA/tmRNA/rRNA uracil-C5-methylase (TrmA/RlmC/RlmD family)